MDAPSDGYFVDDLQVAKEGIHFIALSLGNPLISTNADPRWGCTSCENEPTASTTFPFCQGCKGGRREEG